MATPTYLYYWAVTEVFYNRESDEWLVGPIDREGACLGGIETYDNLEEAKHTAFGYLDSNRCEYVRVYDKSNTKFEESGIRSLL